MRMQNFITIGENKFPREQKCSQVRYNQYFLNDASYMCSNTENVLFKRDRIYTLRDTIVELNNQIPGNGQT